MAHRSRKKHIKHLHQQEPATPKAKSPAAKAKAQTKSAAAGKAKRAPARARTASKARPAKAAAASAPKKRGGIVRSIARAATKKLAARPRRIISKAKTRVKSLIGA